MFLLATQADCLIAWPTTVQSRIASKPGRVNLYRTCNLSNRPIPHCIKLRVLLLQTFNSPLGERGHMNVGRMRTPNTQPHAHALKPRYPARRRQDPSVQPVQANTPAKDSNDLKSPCLAPVTSNTTPLAPNGNPQCWYHPDETETDAHRVAQRSRQIEYGQHTPGYVRYLAQVPRWVFLPAGKHM